MITRMQDLTVATTVTASAIVTTIISAHAQPVGIKIAPGGWWVYWPDGHASYLSDPIFALIVAIAAAVLVGLKVALQNNQSYSTDDSPSTDANAAERYEQEAGRLRALKRKTDAETELTASLIDKGRIDAEYNELKQITAHDRKVRSIRRELER